MGDIQLDDFSKRTASHTRVVEDGFNGFASQPEPGRKYDPSEDKRGTQTQINLRQSSRPVNHTA